MGNCQAIDAATLVIQHPSGKSDKLYWPVTAAEVMKTNPGHYVALLISSALCPSTTKESASSASTAVATAGDQVRVTRIKLLRPPDILMLGQVYRLITNQEVMKVLSAKKQAKMAREGREIRVEQQLETKTKRESPEIRIRKDSLVEKNDEMQMQRQRQKQREHQTSSSSGAPKHSASVGGGGGGGGRSRSWQPTLMSITEAL